MKLLITWISNQSVCGSILPILWRLKNVSQRMKSPAQQPPPPPQPLYGPFSGPTGEPVPEENFWT